MSSIKTVAIVGCGAIGASWAALFAAQGLTVKAFDINPEAEKFLRSMLQDAFPILSSLGLLKSADIKPEDVIFTTDMAEALRDADLVQENGPERLDFKRKLFNDMAALVRPDTIIATSSSGLTCSSIQEGMDASARPQRCVVGHPFNPPHLIPLVEVVGGAQTDAQVIDAMMDFYKAIGKRPIHVKKEVVGHVANRLQAALMREILYILQEGVCNTAEADEAVTYGPGLRWGIMGPATLFHLGGGPGGVEHFANHLLAPLQTWYAPQDPVVDDDLKRKFIEGTKAAVAGREYQDLARERDEMLVKLLKIRQENENSK